MVPLDIVLKNKQTNNKKKEIGKTKSYSHIWKQNTSKDNVKCYNFHMRKDIQIS